MAHFWWSGADFIKEPWMNESFANYSMHRALRVFNPEGYQRNVERTKQAIPVARATLFAPNAYPSYYNKGAILLLQLEERIGQEKMDQLLSGCIKEEIYSASGFLAQLEKMTGPEDRLFFENMFRK